MNPSFLSFKAQKFVQTVNAKFLKIGLTILAIFGVKGTIDETHLNWKCFHSSLKGDFHTRILRRLGVLDRRYVKQFNS